jgi:phosphatidylglycerol lysyltransferase
MKTELAFPKMKKHLQLDDWGVRFSALFTLLVGFVNLISAVQPALRSRLIMIRLIIPLAVRYGSRITSALAGFALLLLASSLWRRKRTAWFLTTLLLILSILTHLTKGLDYEEASLALFVLIILIVFRHAFNVASDPPSLRQGLLVLAAAFGFTLLYGTAGLYLLDRHFSIHFSIFDALKQTVVMFISYSTPALQPTTGFGRYFAGSIYIIGLATLGFALLMLIRPVLVRQPATPEERAHAEAIVKKYGRTSLARATLFNDKSYFFGPGDTVIAYAARGRGAIVLGDPIGLREDIASSISAFRDFCRHNDWSPAFASTMPDTLEDYKAAGFESLTIGCEAIVDLSKFTLEGSENKDIRNAVSHMERLGFKAEVHSPPLDELLMESLREISDEWLSLRRGGEMHFSDGWFEDDTIRNGPVIVVQAVEGTIHAFANLVTEYQKNELTIDLMRHIKKIEHGTMEFLFASMLQWAKSQGYATFSLGLSAIAGVGEKPDDPRIEQALHTLSDYVSRFYNFKGLRNFKEKFHPNWEPRYLIYQGTTSLPLVLSTILQVHTEGNFLWKFLRK